MSLLTSVGLLLVIPDLSSGCFGMTWFLPVRCSLRTKPKPCIASLLLLDHPFRSTCLTRVLFTGIPALLSLTLLPPPLEPLLRRQLAATATTIPVAGSVEAVGLLLCLAHIG